MKITKMVMLYTLIALVAVWVGIYGMDYGATTYRLWIFLPSAATMVVVIVICWIGIINEQPNA